VHRTARSCDAQFESVDDPNQRELVTIDCTFEQGGNNLSENLRRMPRNEARTRFVLVAGSHRADRPVQQYATRVAIR